MALCPKQALPDVLQGIGYTAQPTAILTTETPDSLGLRGYPRNPVLETMATDSQMVEVSRFLTQLGYGAPVDQRLLGPSLC